MDSLTSTFSLPKMKWLTATMNQCPNSKQGWYIGFIYVDCCTSTFFYIRDLDNFTNVY